MNFID